MDASTGQPCSATSALRAELAQIRERLTALEDADREAGDVLGRLVDLSRAAIAARSEARRRLIDSFDRLDALIATERRRRRDELAALQAELDDVRDQTLEFAAQAALIEARLAGIDRRIAAMIEHGASPSGAARWGESAS